MMVNGKTITWYARRFHVRFLFLSSSFFFRCNDCFYTSFVVAIVDSVGLTCESGNASFVI